MKKAFTLAEIMIVLMVIGLLTAILLPSARNAMPNKDLMKFKKAHETLHNTFIELVNSDKYYLNGDLGIKINGDLIDGTHEGDSTYLCETFSDLIKTKNVSCKEYGTKTTYVSSSVAYPFDIWCRNLQKNDCSHNIVSQIKSIDGTTFFEANSFMSFGSSLDGSTARHYTSERSATGFYYVYKGFCMDIDEWCKGEDPFGYGIRVDGKILNSDKANEWLEKSIQDKD